jgi:hypothetical protein
VGEGAVGADAEDDGVGVRTVQLVERRAEQAVLLRADGGEIHRVEKEHDLFLTAVITQADFVLVLVHQLEVRGHLADLQRRVFRHVKLPFVGDVMIVAWPAMRGNR